MNEERNERSNDLLVDFDLLLSLTHYACGLAEALEACLALERVKARAQGFSECCCMSWSRETENAYETGRCPHQKGRAALERLRKSAAAAQPVTPTSAVGKDKAGTVAEVRPNPAGAIDILSLTGSGSPPLAIDSLIGSGGRP